MSTGTVVFNVYACGHGHPEVQPDLGQKYIFAFHLNTCDASFHCRNTDPAWFVDKSGRSYTPSYDCTEQMGNDLAAAIADCKRATSVLDSLGPISLSEIASTTGSDPITSLLTAENRGDALDAFLNISLTKKQLSLMKKFADRPDRQPYFAYLKRQAQKSIHNAAAKAAALHEAVSRLQSFSLFCEAMNI